MDSLKKKIEKFGSVDLIPYGELLDTYEWELTRVKILERDNKKCYKCGLRPAKDVGEDYAREMVYKGFAVLDERRPPMPPCHYWPSHVHHKYYIINKLPWKYEDALVTMCYECHQKLHELETIPVFYEIDGQLVQRYYKPCIRCGGAGWFPEYSHIQNGVCFRCGGWGWGELIVIKNRNIPF